MHRRCTRNATAIVMRHFYQRAPKVWHRHAATHLVNFVTAKLSAGRKSDILCLGVMCLCLLALLIFFILRRSKSSMDLNKVNRCLARYSPRQNHQPTHQQGTRAYFGPILAVFGSNILIFMGVSKSFGTNITENHLGNFSALFFGQALD